MTHTHYHFDHVGSYLRPETLRTARIALQEKRISKEELKALKRIEIKKLVQKEANVGLSALTDGEFNRSWWHLDFLWGLNGVSPYDQRFSYKFHGAITRSTNVKLTGKLSFNPKHPFFDDYEYLKSVIPAGYQTKVTLPSPSMFFRDDRSKDWKNYYPKWTNFLVDLARTYHETLLKYYTLGARYIQLDDTTWAYLISQLTHDQKVEENKQICEDIIFVVNKALEGLPDDLRVSTHICRGNFQSTYLFEGSYAPVASYLGQLNYDTFFLEYDDARSGDFAPLTEIWNARENVFIVLGLITSKTPELEDKATVKARIADAAKLVPLENLGLSTQCGFASTEEGNLLTENEQWDKLRCIKEIADEVWG